MKKYLIIDETTFRSVKDKYHLFSDRDKAIVCLLKLGWKTGGLCGSMEITDEIGMMSMQQDGKDKRLTFVPIEEEPSLIEEEFEEEFEEDLSNPGADVTPWGEYVPIPLEMLKTAPRDGVPPVYVTIFEGIGGWNSGIFRWNEEDRFGYYEPENTGFTNTSLGDGLRESAIREAKGWAESDELPCWIPGEE
ncbi:MAG: hypothetical protein M0R32_10445 [Candidatus Cloacimonetes bacterium]|jgi:hypothetical protein|nr:hypothetical protein [Candidatus Cloacimonadota bacterium]